MNIYAKYTMMMNARLHSQSTNPTVEQTRRGTRGNSTTSDRDRMRRRTWTDIERSENRSLVSSISSKIMSTVESREWAKFFPADIQTEAESVLFIHRLFTVTFSELTARRRIFSHDHFSSKKLGPLSVSLFTRPTSVAEQKRFDATVFSWVCKHQCSKGSRLSPVADSRRF